MDILKKHKLTIWQYLPSSQFRVVTLVDDTCTNPGGSVVFEGSRYEVVEVWAGESTGDIFLKLKGLTVWVSLLDTYEGRLEGDPPIIWDTITTTNTHEYT